MTALDFTPAAGAVPPIRRITRHGVLEARLLTRNGEQLLLALVIPLGILLAGGLARGRFGPLEVVAPSVLALAVWSTGFTSVAIATAFERRYGVLERLAATPLGKTGLIAGKAFAIILIMAGQVLILAGVAVALGWRPAFTVLSAAAALLLVIMATATFVCLGLLIAGRLRAEATLGLANLIYLIVLERYPASVRPVIQALPTAALGEGLRAAAIGYALGWPVIVLAVWLPAAAWVARRGFRWTA
jgi:ABC-2 type transport system permease protein